MHVSVDKLKDDFVSKIDDSYNQEVYFIASCLKFPSKYSLQMYLMDLSLRIHFEENNCIILGGKKLKYCDRDSTNKKIKLADISNELNTPEINIVNNYLVDDKWDKIDW
jgi:hypothetical protein